MDKKYEEFLLNLHPNFEETPEWMPDLFRKMPSISAYLEPKKSKSHTQGHSSKSRGRGHRSKPHTQGHSSKPDGHGSKPRNGQSSRGHRSHKPSKNGHSQNNGNTQKDHV